MSPYVPADPRPCAVEGCDRKADVRGLCSKHYAQWHRGDPDAVEPPLEPHEIMRRNVGECDIEACKRQARSRGVCSSHYMRWLRGARGEDLARPIRDYEPRHEADDDKYDAPTGYRPPPKRNQFVELYSPYSAMPLLDEPQDEML